MYLCNSFEQFGNIGVSENVFNENRVAIREEGTKITVLKSVSSQI